MIIQENKEKIGFGSWYFTRSYNEAAKAQFATLKEFDTHNQTAAFNRVKSEVKDGALMRFRVVGGKVPRWYKGIVCHSGFDRYNGGYIMIKQKNSTRMLNCHYIDEIEIIE